ncbi:MAG: hypothetical protein JKY67_15610, partial [Pseudomonadales bacterium]|nr:hypothetical protein [Pseudomonadales bacterium]
MAENNHSTQHAEWLEYLVDQGATLDNHGILDFGQPNDEIETTNAQSNIIANLDQIGILEVKGEDARQFLQGQITADLDLVSPELGTLGCYVNLQGRAVASFRLIQLSDQQSNDGIPRFLLSMHNSLIPIVMERLQKYIVFSKAELKDVSSEWIKLGLSGAEAYPFIQSRFESSIPSGETINNKNSPI